MQSYLAASKHIDFTPPLVAAKAAGQATDAADEIALARCLEFVRNEIAHSWDFRRNPVICKASDALERYADVGEVHAHLPDLEPAAAAKAQ